MLLFLYYVPDIDECAVNNGGCEGRCVNKLGSHQCKCPRRYRLTTNGRTCIGKFYACMLNNSWSFGASDIGIL